MRIVGNPPSGGKKPTTPTIGTATDDGTGTGVSVAFTPSTYIGKSTITYTATSSPGSLTGTGSGSPITVSGLTTGTAYTFTVTGNTAYGVASDSSAASNSVTPASPSSFESIATANGTGSSGTITFSSIPSTYKHLQIRALTKINATGNTYDAQIQFNSDTGSNYTQHQILGDGASVTLDANANLTSIYTQDFTLGTASGAITNVMSTAIIDIIDYASTSKYKTVKVINGFDTNRSTAPVGQMRLFSGLWRSTSAISSITITCNTNWANTTTFALYGIKG